MLYNNSQLYYDIRANTPDGRPVDAYPLVALIERTKHHVAFEDSEGLTHHILNCEVSVNQIPRSEETEKFVPDLHNPAQIITRVTHYIQDGSTREYDKVSDVTFNHRRREVSFVTEDGQEMTIRKDPVLIDEHFPAYDPSRDYTQHPTFGPIPPFWKHIVPDGNLQ